MEALTPQARDALARRYRERLGPVPSLGPAPSVSIVVLNRNGKEHLERLLTGLVRATDYAPFELVLIDNASTDGSVELLRRSQWPFPCVVIPNDRNVSFSDGCNQGADAASGELLLFMNNDVEPFESGWLTELVACRHTTGAAAVSATLLHGPESAKRSGAASRPLLQHRGVGLVREGSWLAPVNLGDGEHPDAHVGVDVRRAALTAACLLVERQAFSAVEGFTSGFYYGWEDVDLALKLAARGELLVCSGRALAFHDESSTRIVSAAGVDEPTRALNRRLLMLRWGPTLYREYMLDRLAGRGFWSSPDPPSAVVLGSRAGASGRLAEDLIELGWRAESLEPDVEGLDDAVGTADCVIVLDNALEGPVPPHGTSVAWVADAADAHLAGLQGADAVVAADEHTADVVSRRTGRAATVLGRRPDAGRPAAGAIAWYVEERVRRPRYCIASARPAESYDGDLQTLWRGCEGLGRMCRFVAVAGDELPPEALLTDVAIHLSTRWRPAPAQFNVLFAAEPPAMGATPGPYDLHVAPREAEAGTLEAAFAEAARPLRIEPGDSA